MTPNLIDDILTNTYTQTDALRRLRVLKELLIAKLFGGSQKIDEETSEQDDLWVKTMAEKLADKVDKKNIYKLFDETEKSIKKIEPLVIFIPFDMPGHEVTTFGQQVRSAFGKNFLMDLKYEPGLIAGAAFVWKGVMKDYSVRQKIAENRQVILEAFKEYIKH